jgi:hypothetical protein
MFAGHWSKLFYHFVCAKLTDKEIDQIEKGDIVFDCEPCGKKKITRIFKRGVSVSESEIKNVSLNEIVETQNELKGKLTGKSIILILLY